MRKIIIFLVLQAILVIGVYADAYVDKAKKIVANATKMITQWTGPTTGPVALKNKKVILVAGDMKNDGHVGVIKGVQEAGKAIDWKIEVLDGSGSVKNQVASLNQAIAKKPDAIGLIGWDPNTAVQPLRKATKLGIKLVSWQVSPNPGPIKQYNIFFNITTDATEVADIAAMYAVAQSNGTAKVVIFTDSLYSIALAKARNMEKVIKACTGCEVLEFIDTPISDTSSRMPQMTFSLMKRYGDKLEYMLAINDLYFDFSAASLRTARKNRLGPPYNISAGDGSGAAYQRIRKGQYQTATVPGPLNLQGWQMIDEMNRALSGQKSSGYIAPVYLVTKDNIDANGGNKNRYDPNNGYREAYKKIWKIR